MTKVSVMKGLQEYYGNARAIQLIGEFTGYKDYYYDGVIKQIEYNKSSYPNIYEKLKNYEDTNEVAKRLSKEQKVCIRTAFNRLYKEAKKLIEVIETYEELKGRI